MMQKPIYNLQDINIEVRANNSILIKKRWNIEILPLHTNEETYFFTRLGPWGAFVFLKGRGGHLLVLLLTGQLWRNTSIGALDTFLDNG